MAAETSTISRSAGELRQLRFRLQQEDESQLGLRSGDHVPGPDRSSRVIRLLLGVRYASILSGREPAMRIAPLHCDKFVGHTCSSLRFLPVFLGDGESWAGGEVAAFQTMQPRSSPCGYPKGGEAVKRTLREIVCCRARVVSG